MSVDWTKPIQTRDGRKAEFVRRVNARSDTQKIWCVVEHFGFEEMASFNQDGQHFEVPTSYDIVNAPEEKVLGVMNVYPTFCEQHGNRQYADDGADGLPRTHVITIIRCGQEVKTLIEKVS